MGNHGELLKIIRKYSITSYLFSIIVKDCLYFNLIQNLLKTLPNVLKIIILDSILFWELDILIVI